MWTHLLLSLSLNEEAEVSGVKLVGLCCCLTSAKSFPLSGSSSGGGEKSRAEDG